MDQNGTNPYSTEIPVTEAEKQLQSQTGTPQTPPAQPTNPSAPPQPSQPASGTPLPPPPTRMHNNILPKVIIGVLLIAILSLSAYIVSNKMNTNSAPQPTPTVSIPTPTTIPTATPTPTPDAATTSADPSSIRFYSKELGIMFDTAKTLPGNSTTIKTLTSGSRVYVYMSTAAPTSGQYVDVLSKVSTDDTATAAQKVTANDPNYKNCTFTLVSQTSYPSTYEKAEPTCPPGPGAGLSFFLSDTTQPTKLLFVSIGQYAIPASSNPQSTWQDTLRLLSTSSSQPLSSESEQR